MALPAHRVIGHKEYGNTAPGGYPGRKTDPVYDMNWRRARVANFTPRGDDDMTALDDLINFRVNGRNLWDFLKDIHQETTGKIPSRLPGDKGADTMFGYSASAHAEAAMAHRVAAEVRDLIRSEQLASPAPVDAAAVAAALATNGTFIAAMISGLADEMDRRGRDGDPTTGPVS